MERTIRKGLWEERHICADSDEKPSMWENSRPEQMSACTKALRWEQACLREGRKACWGMAVGGEVRGEEEAGKEGWGFSTGPW